MVLGQHGHGLHTPALLQLIVSAGTELLCLQPGMACPEVKAAQPCEQSCSLDRIYLLRKKLLLSAGNATFAEKFSNCEPDVALTRPERAAQPYVNMFRVVTKDDVVPKVSTV